MFIIPQLFLCARLADRFPAESFLGRFFSIMAWHSLCILTGDYSAILEPYYEEPVAG